MHAPYDTYTPGGQNRHAAHDDIVYTYNVTLAMSPSVGSVRGKDCRWKSWRHAVYLNGNSSLECSSLYGKRWRRAQCVGLAIGDSTHRTHVCSLFRKRVYIALQQEWSAPYPSYSVRTICTNRARACERDCRDTRDPLFTHRAINGVQCFQRGESHTRGCECHACNDWPSSSHGRYMLEHALTARCP